MRTNEAPGKYELLDELGLNVDGERNFKIPYRVDLICHRKRVLLQIRSERQ